MPMGGWGAGTHYSRLCMIRPLDRATLCKKFLSRLPPLPLPLTFAVQLYLSQNYYLIQNVELTAVLTHFT